MRKVIRRRRCRWRRSLSMHHSRRTRGCGLRSTAARSRRSNSAATRAAAATRRRSGTRRSAVRTTWSRSGVVVQSSCNLRMDLTRRSSRHSRVWSKSLAHRSRKGMICSNRASRRRGSRRGCPSISDRNDRSWRTPARRGFTVNDLFQAAMFKQNMLPSVKIVGRFAKLVGDPQRRSVAPMVVNAGIAASRNSKPQIKRARSLELQIAGQASEQRRLSSHPCVLRSLRDRERASAADFPGCSCPAVRCSPLVAHTRTVPPRSSWISAVWSFAVTVVLPTSTARPFVISSAPETVASCTPMVPMGCCCAIAPAEKSAIGAI